MPPNIVPWYLLNPHVVCDTLRSDYASDDDTTVPIIPCKHSPVEIVQRVILHLKIEAKRLNNANFETYEKYAEHHIAAAFVYMERVKRHSGRVSRKNASILFVVAVFVAGKIIDDWPHGAGSFCRVLGCDSPTEVTDAERHFLEAIDHNLFIKKEDITVFF